MPRPAIGLIVLFVAVWPVTADEPEVPGLKLDFPAVEGFRLEAPHIFPQTGLGYSRAYRAPGVVATVYVYNKGLAEVPAGAKSATVKKEMQQAADDIETARQQGLYKSAAEVGKEEVIRLGKGKDAPSALRRTFDLERPKDGEFRSVILLTGYKDHFIKLRISYSRKEEEAAEKKMAVLLAAIGKSLK